MFLDLLEKVTDNGTVVAEYTYYSDGTKKNLVNGSLYTEYSYDADQNLAGLKAAHGNQLLADDRYRYDHNGNRLENSR